VSESIGEYISRQRRLRGISLEELADSTRIPRRSLERLEAGAFDATPDGFARGFVRTVAEALGLEPDEAVNRMRPEPQSLPGRGPARPRATLLLALLAALLAAGLVAGARLLARAPGPAPADAARDPAPVRRDAVRALAESVGALSPEDEEGRP
jgi:transcriptional regulator with XRE-family HTH domain